MSRFLKYMRADSFGGLHDCQVGPLGPGLNVVYGPNEAGKSTLSALVRGVLFGWEEAHGVRNTYRPPEGDRSGSLDFAGSQQESGVPQQALTTIARDEAGVQGDMSAFADIDRSTYDAIFSFSADELRSLRGSSDVTARLLAAESGTGSGPSAAFVEVEQRIAACTARATDDGDSIFSLESQLEAKREEMKRAAERNELLIQEHRELRELRASRASTSERIEAANSELEDLSGWRAELYQVDQRASQCQDELDRLRDERAELVPDVSASDSGETPRQAIDKRLLALDSTDERVLRDRLDEFAEEREKLDRIVDAAKENSATSTAAYEALMEIDEDELKARRSLRNRSLPTVISLLLPVAFIVSGIPMFVHGRQINSLSFTALGVGLIVFSVLLATAAIVNLFRRPQAAAALEDRKQDAQWVMLQDSKKLTACQADKDRFEEELRAAMEAAGLGEANGSIRQARTLLDEASEQRAALAAACQRTSSIDMRIRANEKELAERRATRERIAEQAGLPANVTLREFDAVIRDKSAQRDALLEALEGMSERFGELTRELGLAKTSREFDQLKLEYFELRTRLRERKHELVTLLIARRLLERSISAWETQSQPEVYSWAGRLLATITDGRWVEVSTSGTGSLVAVSADGEQRDPRHLSLGTCQQLYLALRMTLLITAREVGRSVPVMADDILVHFDADRRRGAAKALATLAEYRQVVVFTCHEDIAETLKAAAPTAIRINLQ